MEYNCKYCSSKLRGVTCYDSGDQTENPCYAWNLYVCNNCGTIMKESVWCNEGVIWITSDNKIEHIIPRLVKRTNRETGQLEWIKNEEYIK